MSPLDDGGKDLEINPMDGTLAKLTSVCLEDGDRERTRREKNRSGHIVSVVFRIFRSEH